MGVDVGSLVVLETKRTYVLKCFEAISFIKRCEHIWCPALGAWLGAPTLGLKPCDGWKHFSNAYWKPSSFSAHACSLLEKFSDPSTKSSILRADIFIG